MLINWILSIILILINFLIGINGARIYGRFLKIDDLTLEESREIGCNRMLGGFGYLTLILVAIIPLTKAVKLHYNF